MKSFIAVFFLVIASGYGLSEIEMANLRANKEKQMLSFAKSLMQERKYTQAALYFGDFIDLFPNSRRKYQAYEELANIARKQQDYSRAIKIYGYLYETKGQSGLEYLYQKALLVEKTEEDKEAIRLYRQIAKQAAGSGLKTKAEMRLRLLEILPLTDN